jgi:Ca2+-binding EF-hand superfamily protein
MRKHHKADILRKEAEEQKQGLREKPRPPSPVERSRSELISAVQLLEAALVAYNAKRGIHTAPTEGTWPKFFKDCDKDGSGRVTFQEIEKSICERLRRYQCATHEVIRGVARDDLIGLWHVADADQSGEVTAKEWQKCLYCIDIEGWPDAEPEHLGRVVDEINAAAQHWHRAGGNWFKVFRFVDTDDSGQMGFEELKAMCYRPLPCLAIPQKRLREMDLRALWKALDNDLSGFVSVAEFMTFMRKHGSEQFHNSARSKTPRFVGLSSRAEMHSGEDERSVLSTLEADQLTLLSAAIGKQTSETVAAAYKRWGLSWTGLISEWDFHAVFRKLLGIREDQIGDDAIYMVWSFVDSECAGQVAVDQFLALATLLLEARKGDANSGASSP